MKLPPKEKIPEAYSAVVDERVRLDDAADAKAGSAVVSSSDGAKSYELHWTGSLFYSNDNASYWQSYPGYPVIAVLMRLGRLPYDPRAASVFSGVNWHELNARFKRDYEAALASVLAELDPRAQASVSAAIDACYERLASLDLKLTRKKSLFTS